MKSMRTVIEMKTFSIIFSTICVRIVFALVPKEVCDNNFGNLKILDAFRYKSDYYFFAEGMKAFKLSGYWGSRDKEMYIREFEWLNDSQWTNTENVRLITTVDYPGKGKRVLRMDKAQVDSIDQLVGYLLELDFTGAIISRTNIPSNIYTCAAIPEPMNLCALFAKFPQKKYWELFNSLTAFPSADGVDPRFLVYYTEEPHSGQGMDGQYRSMRYIMVGRNETIINSPSPKLNWFIDTTKGLECKDLKRRVIDASMTLTDDYSYSWRGSFDVVEFSDYEYSISHIRVEENSVYGPGDWKSAGNIGEFFGCNQTGYTRPTTPGPSPTKSSFPILWIILLILLILAVIGVIACCLIAKGKTASEPTAPPPASAPTPAPASTPGPTVENADSAITPMNSDTTTVRSNDSLTTGSGSV